MKKLFGVALLSALLFVAYSPQADASTFNLTINGPTSVTVGDDFDVTLTVTGPTDFVSMSAIFKWTSTLFSYKSFKTLPAGWTASETSAVGALTLNGTGNAQVPVDLYTITFTALQSTTVDTEIKITGATTYDTNYQPIGYTSSPLTIGVEPASEPPVGDVPEPGAVALIVMGIGALGMGIRRKRG